MNTKNKIVDSGLKCDFHIHSYHSQFKEEKGLTSNNTESNLDTLIEKLDANEIKIASITDHDVFSYDMYKLFKEKAKNQELILPGVEFTVSMEDEKHVEKPIHVITLFNDSNMDAIKNIETVLGEGIKNKPKYDSLDGSAFSQHKYLQLLKEIGLDVVLIAHQKKTLTSQQTPAKNDVNSLGENIFNVLLFVEFFQALEFHNKNNELFNIIKKSEYKDDVLRFITGSDCHDWECYPNHDSSTNDDSFKFTFLKCLPTFRGVSLALTESSRIGLENSFFSISQKQLDSIDLKIDDTSVSIPLSKGINAIIGDNSIGKSLLIHKITNYYRRERDKDTSAIADSKICKQYDAYLAKNNISVDSFIDSDFIYEFDSQGEIRKKFTLGKLKKTSFIEKRHKKNIYIDSVRVELEKYAREYISTLKQLKDKNSKINALQNLRVEIPTIDLKAKTLKFISFDYVEYENEKLKLDKILIKFRSVLDVVKQLTEFADEAEKIIINDFIKQLESMISKRTQELTTIKNKIETIEIINGEIDAFNSNQTSTIDDKIIKKFENQKNTLSTSIKSLLLIGSEEKEFSMPSIESKEIPTEKFNCGNLKIVTCSNVHLIDNDYLFKLFASPLKKSKFNKNTFISDSNLGGAILRHDASKDPWEEYESNVIETINNDIKESIKINYQNEDDYMDHSSGLNERMYFEVLSTDNSNEGIYFIDQPEDDISQTAIRDVLISCLKKMSKNRQIILITHNPQFVVNLDVDNVICLLKGSDGKLKIHSGALEYKDENEDILKDVAETLDGGVLTIRKRWKKYEKNINDLID